MPLKKCTVEGKAGWQWGAAGKCYTGTDAKKQAIKQGVAIEGPEKFSQKAIEQNISLDTKDVAVVAEWMYDNGYDNKAVVATVSTLSSYAKTKEEWDKINKKELKRDTKKEQKEHEKDAVKDDKEKVKKLKKGDPSEKKKREVRDLKKDERYDKRDAKGASDKEEYRQDKKELKRDTKKERKEHEKDAIEDDKEKIKRLKKEKPSERKNRELRDLKKDKREDKRDVKEGSKSAKLTSKQINDLPDSEFAYIAPGGKKVDGKTEPRSLRHLPIPDAAHVRNALARLSQTDIPSAAKKEALSKIKSKAKRLGIHVSDESKAIYAGYRTTSMFMDRLGYGHFHTLTKDATHTSKSRTSFGDIIVTGHTHDIVDGKIVAAKDQEGHTHTHEIKDIGPGEGWVYEG